MNNTVIMDRDLFCLSNPSGDITADSAAGYGLYAKDTRFLSAFDLQMNGEKLELLSVNQEKSYHLKFKLMKRVNDVGALEVFRERYIYNGSLHERMIVKNYFPHVKDVRLQLAVAGDFQDMFLVRQYRDGEVGTIKQASYTKDSIGLQYIGKDEVARYLHMQWDTVPDEVTQTGHIKYDRQLAPGQSFTIEFMITPQWHNASSVSFVSFDRGLAELAARYEQWQEQTISIESDHPQFNKMVAQSSQDLHMLLNDFGFGSMPVAGLPWFAAPFGRDSIITSLYMLIMQPDAAKGTLKTLAAWQGEQYNAERDEQPGKIMHEKRFGELVLSDQSPFGPYYGTVDATPLFLMLIVEYVKWTGDLALFHELQPEIEKALQWIDVQSEQYGGFLSYAQEAEQGFPNQGWKDSPNCIVHSDGQLATSPIALSEVQGYVYYAKKELARLYSHNGNGEQATKLQQQASELQAKFEQTYWLEDEGYYAIALEQHQAQVHSVTSNPGHLLLCELPQMEREQNIVERLQAEDMNSGFGIRTMSTLAAGYYPMSYHNGSVWPHDNAFILLGLSRRGYIEAATHLMDTLLEASYSFRDRRFPELFCGYENDGAGVVPYPTTCSPQAWSAGLSIVFIQASLGLHPDAIAKKIWIAPALPSGMNYLKVNHIRIGSGLLSIEVTRSSTSQVCEVNILSNSTSYEIVHRKGRA